MIENIFSYMKRKTEIDAVVGDLRRKYKIPPCTTSKLLDLAEEFNSKVHFSSILPVPISARSDEKKEQSYIIIPDCGERVNTYNLAHELGHIVLDTSVEIEATYFSAALTSNRNVAVEFLVDHALSSLALHTFYFSQLKGSQILRQYVLEQELDELRAKGFPEDLLGETILDCVFANMVPKDFYENLFNPKLIRRSE